MSKDERGRPTRRGQPYLEEPEAKPFWANLPGAQTNGQRCSSCKKMFGFPPQSHCPHCLASEHEWVPLSGKGKYIRISPIIALGARPTRTRFPTTFRWSTWTKAAGW